jgi:hypothetical protein
VFGQEQLLIEAGMEIQGMTEFELRYLKVSTEGLEIGSC